MANISDCIAFLERAGAGDIPREALLSEGVSRLAETGIGGDTEASILAGDVHSLARLLDAPMAVCCLIAPGEDDDEDDEDDEDDDDEDDDDEDEEDEEGLEEEEDD
jgi:cobalamin biosynthesis protein CobT